MLGLGRVVKGLGSVGGPCVDGGKDSRMDAVAAIS